MPLIVNSTFKGIFHHCLKARYTNAYCSEKSLWAQGQHSMSVALATSLSRALLAFRVPSCLRSHSIARAVCICAMTSHLKAEASTLEIWDVYTSRGTNEWSPGSTYDMILFMQIDSMFCWGMGSQCSIIWMTDCGVLKTQMHLSTLSVDSNETFRTPH